MALPSHLSPSITTLFMTDFSRGNYTSSQPNTMALAPTKVFQDVAAAVEHGPVDSLKSKLVRLVEVPAWMHQGQFIERAYRKQQDSFYGCFKSLWYIHNETVNIWSHLIVGVFFLAMAIWAAIPALHGDYAFKRADLLALQTYLIGAAVCCLFSVRVRYSPISRYA